MGSSWTVPAISANGVMHFPLPARPSQVEFHEDKEKDHNVKEGREEPKENKKNKTKKANAKAKANRLPQPVAEPEPCAEPEPPEADASHPQPEAPQSARERLDEPGIEDDYKDQCDCDGYGNELAQGICYIISMDACMKCPWCVWKQSMCADRTANAKLF